MCYDQCADNGYRHVELAGGPDAIVYTDRQKAQERVKRGHGRLNLRAQFVGAYDGWIVEGTFRSDPYANPFIARRDGSFSNIYGKVARR